MTTPENPGAAITINADEGGIIVTGQLGGGASVPPTRHTEALRRRTLNRARRRQQLATVLTRASGCTRSHRVADTEPRNDCAPNNLHGAQVVHGPQPNRRHALELATRQSLAERKLGRRHAPPPRRLRSRSRDADGAPLEGFGCAGTSATAYGLACMELEPRTAACSRVSVQGSLAIVRDPPPGRFRQPPRCSPRRARRAGPDELGGARRLRAGASRPRL
jgi:hypothetical protein